MGMFGTTKFKRHVTTTISNDLYDRCQKAGFGFNYALSVGIRNLLKDETIITPKEVEMERKLAKLSEKLSAVSQRLYKATGEEI